VRSTQLTEVITRTKDIVASNPQRKKRRPFRRLDDT
jgi:hypothetical protein